MEFNPDFSFDFRGAKQDADPWDLSAAVKDAARPHPRRTTLDDKIKARVSQMAERKGKKQSKASLKRKRESPEPESEDSEDEPLPGEVEADESDDDELGVHESSSDDDADLAADDDNDDSGAGDEDDAADDDNADDDDQFAIDNHGQESSDSDGAFDDDEDGASSDEDAEAAPAPSRPPASAKRKAARGAAAAAASSDDDDDDEEAPVQQRRGSSARATTSGAPPPPAFFSDQPNDTKFSASGFAELNLSRPLVKACTKLGYERPTPIQAACIPLALMGRDIVGSAITGSGKTAAFALPLLERLLFRQKRVVATYVLVLAPVRELAVQVHSMITKLAEFTDVRAAIVVGGLSMAAQAAELRKGPEIVVATPGRIIDHILNTMSFELDSLSALVLDEADRLLDMGFMEEISQIIKLAPTKRQTLLFSATMTDEVRKLVALSLHQPVRLAADKRAAAPAKLRQEIIRLKGAEATDKDALLLSLCARALAGKRTIVFCTHKWRAHKLKVLLGLAEMPPAAELHGDMTQAARLEALDAFRRGAATVLLATDVAARGLDITGVTTVINYDCPATVETYLHRIGRTARAGQEGLAISFVEDGDRRVIKDVVKQVKAALAVRVVPEKVVAQWRARAEKLYLQVADVIQEERHDKMLRKAEMESTKAINMIEHASEIYSRPKREWFQTAKEKAESSALGDAPDADADDKRKGRSSKAARNASSKGEKVVKRPPPEHVAETEKHMGRVRAAKSAARKMREGGTKPKESAKAALTSVTGITSVKKKAKKQKVSSEVDADPTGVRAPRNSHVYEGGGRSAAVRRAAVGPSKSEKARFARGGKGKSQFKSKARHKRK